MQALIGLGGILIGGFSAAGVAWWTHRSGVRSRRRKAARVLLGEATALRAAVKRALDEHTVIEDIGRRVDLLTVWREHEDLGELPFPTWEAVTFLAHEIGMTIQDAEVLAHSPWSDETERTYAKLSELLEITATSVERASR